MFNNLVLDNGCAVKMGMTKSAQCFIYLFIWAGNPRTDKQCTFTKSSQKCFLDYTIRYLDLGVFCFLLVNMNTFHL